MSPKGPPSPNLRWADPPPKRRTAAKPMIKNVRLHKKKTNVTHSDKSDKNHSFKF
jgi:hypothetical protein